MKTITITTLFGTIQIELSEPHSEGKRYGRITHPLQIAEPGEDSELDILESLILAHACAGVDVEAEAYIEGINTTLEAIDNNS